ncbi:hypothetical protein GCM10023224_34290 [Streptomonospora halophila]|uniref:HTH luxR-type domain-containing protein n=1 Tax=Streptomonospora halophila TaxID=427369 RepID=A0ABP9GTW7_9ACTN
MDTLAGRTHELNELGRALEETLYGDGRHVTVEGPPGIGKTRLVSQLAGEAEELGMLVLRGTATRLDRVAPWSTLMRLFVGRPELHRSPPTGTGSSGCVFDFSLRLATALTEHARRQPLVIVLDDMHWSDEMTALILPTLTQHTRGEPILWLVARCPMSDRGSVAEVLQQLTGGEGSLLRLGPLADDEVADLLRRALGEPTRAQLGLKEKCSGIPALLMQVVAALKDPAALDQGLPLEVADLPGSVHRRVVDRLHKLSPAVHPLLQVGAVLERPFSLHEAARLLDAKAAALIPAVEEALANEVMVSRDGRLEVANDLTLESVYLTISPPARHALHREASAMLREQGDRGGTEVVRHMVHCAETETELAAYLSRSLAAGDVEAGALGDTVHLLTARGRLTEAHDVITTVLESIDSASQLCAALTVVQEASPQLASMLNFPHHVERALKAVEPGSAAQAGLQAVQATSFLEHGRSAEAAAAAEEAVELARSTGSRSAEARAEFVRVRLAFGDGDLAASQRLACRTLSVTESSPDASGVERTARLVLAVTLAARDEFDDALAVVDMVQREEALAGDPGRVFWEAGRAQLLLWRGELDRAEAVCRGVDPGADPSGELGREVRSLLGQMHLLRGEAYTAAQYFNRVLAGEQAPACPRWQETALGLALATAYQTTAPSGFAVAAAIYDRVPENATLLLRSPDAAAGLVRLALAADRRDAAERVVCTSLRLARDNPGVASLEGAARHAEGLFRKDRRLLEAAVERYTDSPRVLARAHAGEDAAQAAALGEDSARAVELMAGAHEDYRRCGARGSMERSANAMRKLSAEGSSLNGRPGCGREWEGLSDSERRVALLVSDGLTNQEVAERLFLSPHTVDSHLRSSFRKLAVRNRVELARLVLARASCA